MMTHGLANFKYTKIILTSDLKKTKSICMYVCMYNVMLKRVLANIFAAESNIHDIY
jgi:hypothetical protein